jgi:hypothetical protein
MGFPRYINQDIPLRPIVSSVGSPCCALAGKSEYFVKNLVHSVQLLKSVNLQSLDTLVSFDVVSRVTNVSVNKGLQVIRNKLHNDDTLAEWSVLQVEAIMELLEVCLRTTYIFRWMTSSSSKKMTWLWEALYHPSLATSSWSILRNCF